MSSFIWLQAGGVSENGTSVTRTLARTRAGVRSKTKRDSVVSASLAFWEDYASKI
jgi:hypothetical protein